MVGENQVGSSSRLRMMLAVTGVICVAASIVWAVASVGTPHTARLQELDRARVGDLQTIRRAVERYYKDKATLPSSLDDLTLDAEDLTDPETGASYGYAIDSAQRYHLTAHFSLASVDERNYYGQDWRHDAGHHEFSFDAPKPED